MKLVVDTNIVFSALLNSSGNIAKILLSTNESIEFFSCDFLKDELNSHHKKIQKYTKLSMHEVNELIDLVCSNIIFIDERLLPTSSIKSAYDLVQDIDEKDLPFVAMSIHFKAFLWTGDKQLYIGLVKKNYKKVINTTSLLKKLYR